MRFSNKVVMITGAAQGIGAEIAARFAAEGALTYVCDLKETEGRALVEKIKAGGGEGVYLRLDVTDETNWREAMGLIKEQSGRLDVLVNNAGISVRMPFEEYPVEVLDQMINVNIKGVFLGMKHAVLLMKEQKAGCILNMSSIAGLIGHKYSSIAYIATKGAVTMMTKGVATQYAPYNIRANSIHPSTVETPLAAELFSDPEKKRQRLEEVPLGRFATTNDVAAVALFLASDEAAFITGVSLPVDGGLTAS
ncbi:MAG TPA: SDR family oxidoreductase [Firmicutes bacterium]|jgi:cyclopentanol dehydrogenase|nr:SDR family oxidoreductase [Bacillota bacterium]